MNQTRTDQRQQTVGADVRSAEMPQGQAPAVRQEGGQPSRPMTAMEQSRRATAEKLEYVLTAVKDRRLDFDTLLTPFGVDFDFFYAGLNIGLRKAVSGDPSFFDAKFESVMDSALQIARMGLIADGKKAAIVRFKDVAQAMPMADGLVDILHATAMVRDINHDVVIAGDGFEYQQGDDGYIRHSPSLTRDTDGDVVGAWCIITTISGGRYAEVTGKKELEKIAAMSRSANGPRGKWKSEMARIAPMRRLYKRLPKAKGMGDTALARLATATDAMDATFNLEAPTDTAGRRAVEARRMTHEEMFSDTRGRLDAPEDEERQGDAVEGDAGQTEAQPAPEDQDVLESLRRAIGDGGTPKERQAMLEQIKVGPHWPHLSVERQDELAAIVGGLQAIISSTDREPRRYEDAKLWAFDILAKMQALKAEPLKVFWRKNEAFVAEAQAENAEAVQRILQVATEKGLVTGDQA